MSRSIFQLDSVVASQIAAGEVVERPSSIVKELVDNAIDSGATEIIVEMEGGGARLLRVVDNGSGMTREDLSVCAFRHTTSKIRSIEDLDTLSSRGFRGEALSSIASVSRLRITSCCSDDGLGHELVVCGGEISDVVEVPAAARGTSVEVRQLFFNTPARKKFLKSESYERLKIVGWLKKASLGFPAIGLTVLSDSETILSLPACSLSSQRAQEVLREDSLVPVSFAHKGMSIVGLVAGRASLKRREDNQIILVNRKLVADRTILKAVKQALIERTGSSDNNPSFFLDLTVSPDEVDFNVHPQKSEVRFARPSDIFELTMYSVRNAIRGEGSRFFSSIENSLSTASVSSGSYTESNYVNSTDAYGISRQESSRVPGTIPYRFGGQDRGVATSTYRSIDNGNFSRTDTGADYVGSAYSRPLPFSDFPDAVPSATSLVQLVVPEVERLQASEIRIFDIVLSRYFVGVRGGNLVLIDFHALHERVNYDRIKAELAKSSIQHPVHSQLRVTPVLVPLSDLLPDILLERKDSQSYLNAKIVADGVARVLTQFGFLSSVNCDDLIGPSLSIIGTPLLRGYRVVSLSDQEILSIGSEIVVSYTENCERPDDEVLGHLYESYLHKVAAKVSCVSSLRTKDRISVEEGYELLRLLREFNSPLSCPHGRPLLVEIEENYINKLFMR